MHAGWSNDIAPLTTNVDFLSDLTNTVPNPLSRLEEKVPATSSAVLPRFWQFSITDQLFKVASFVDVKNKIALFDHNPDVGGRPFGPPPSDGLLVNGRIFGPFDPGVFTGIITDLVPTGAPTREVRGVERENPPPEPSIFKGGWNQ